MIDSSLISETLLHKWLEQSDKFIFKITKDLLIIDSNNAFEVHAQNFKSLKELLTYTHITDFSQHIKSLNEDNPSIKFVTNFSFDKNDVEDIPTSYDIAAEYHNDQNIVLIADPKPPLTHEDTKAYFSLVNDYSTINRDLKKTKSNLINKKKELQEYTDNLEVKVDEMLKSKYEQEQLFIQTSKMAGLGEMLSYIAHQWKQPLAVMSMTSANMIIDEQFSEISNKNVISKAQDIQEQIQFMSSTMDDFRSFFHAKDEKKAFPLNLASRTLVNIFTKDFQAQGMNIVFHENTPETIEVIGYENMYRQALLNIIVNARDIINEKNPTNKNIDITFEKDDTFGLISIQDYAGNIPEEIIDKIFIKNFTTKGDEGSGIGLAMTKEIVESFCNGKVEVENTENGVIFTIYIPLRSVQN